MRRVFGMEGAIEATASAAAAKAVGAVWATEAVMRLQALGQLRPFPRRPDGRYLLLLRGQCPERLRDEVRMRRDHVLPPGRVHHVRRVTPGICRQLTKINVLYQIQLSHNNNLFISQSKSMHLKHKSFTHTLQLCC